MKLKVFSVPAKNRKPTSSFDALEADVNAWLADHPNLVIEHTHDVAQPSAVWSHVSLAVWYSET